MPATPELDQRFGVEILIPFGSAARGAMHSESDIDLAALFCTRPDPGALLEASADCERLLGRSVDLIAASPILAMQLIRDGKCILGSESSALAAFTATLLSRHVDLKRVRAPVEAALAERITRSRS